MITIIHPSRGRPHKSYATISKWIARAGMPIEVVVSLDIDDIELQKYVELYSGFGESGHTVMSSRNRSAIDAINNAMKEAKGDLFVVVSDDTDCPNKWAVRLAAYTKGLRDFVLKTDDGIQRRIITMPIFDRVYYNRFGYVYNPEYGHLFVDAEYSDVAYKLKRVVTKMALKFPHNHYSRRREQPDAIHLKNEATYTQDKATYLRRKKINFGL